MLKNWWWGNTDTAWYKDNTLRRTYRNWLHEWACGRTQCFLFTFLGEQCVVCSLMEKIWLWPCTSVSVSDFDEWEMLDADRVFNICSHFCLVLSYIPFTHILKLLLHFIALHFHCISWFFISGKTLLSFRHLTWPSHKKLISWFVVIIT